MKKFKTFILSIALALFGLLPTMYADAQGVTFNATVIVPAGLPGVGGGGAYSQRPVIHAPDARAPAFKKGSGNTLLLKAGTVIEMGGVQCAPTTDQSVSLPTLVAGTDYRVVGKPTDCTYSAITYSDSVAAGSFVLGGFHHLIGSPATGLDTGGGWTPTLLEWSIWDLSFRPKLQCDPRGMTRIGNANFWSDIYFPGDSSNADGVSRNNDPILTGTNPPIRPVNFGGNGVAKYSSFNYWEANEFGAQWGKRLPTYEELTLATFGTNEGDGRGAHPGKTGFATANTPPSSDPNFTSIFGLIQSTGVLWTWTSTPGYWPGTPTVNTWGWEAYDNTGGRGKWILDNPSGATRVLHGGSHVYTSTGSPTGAIAVAGSRAGESIETIPMSSTNLTARYVCDHGK